ncbi:MAG TPA: TadE/TadG family type IV pilus assembly protein [Rhizomicrobium sp.]|jgi:Flp pilus assembly protein TadG|nr:TadE/TadG family type IV pilus assembly protein [Rhizomicrobium sp.]
MRAIQSSFFGTARSLVVKSARDRSGLAGIEFAFIAPVLALMFIMTVDLGLGVYTKMEVEAAVQAGAEYASLNGYNSSAITSAVSNATNVSGLSVTPAPNQFCGCPSHTGVTTATCGSTCASGDAAGSYVNVGAQATYSTILTYPSIVSSSYTFSSQATVRVK